MGLLATLLYAHAHVWMRSGFCTVMSVPCKTPNTTKFGSFIMDPCTVIFENFDCHPRRLPTWLTNIFMLNIDPNLMVFGFWWPSLYIEWCSHDILYWDFFGKSCHRTWLTTWHLTKHVHQRSPPSKLNFWIFRTFLGFPMFGSNKFCTDGLFYAGEMACFAYYTRGRVTEVIFHSLIFC